MELSAFDIVGIVVVVLLVVAQVALVYTKITPKNSNRTDETDETKPLYPKKPFNHIVKNDVLVYEFAYGDNFAKVVGVVRDVHNSGKMITLEDVKMISGTMGEHLNKQVGIAYDSTKFSNLRFVHNTNIYKDRVAVLNTLQGKEF